jgi:hypothetical protein
MIKVSVRGVDQLKKFFSELTPAARKAAVKGASEYLIGNDQRGLKHYPSYKYVTRKSAYGHTFSSDKQRRYVMAMIREGRIDPGVPHRTGELQGAWGYTGKDTRYTIKNTSPYAQFVMGDNAQSRMHKIIGWRTVSDVIKTNLKGAFRHAQAKVKQWLKEHKKG